MYNTFDPIRCNEGIYCFLCGCGMICDKKIPNDFITLVRRIYYNDMVNLCNAKTKTTPLHIFE